MNHEVEKWVGELRHLRSENEMLKENVRKLQEQLRSTYIRIERLGSDVDNLKTVVARNEL